jgi:hypothetical protein
MSLIKRLVLSIVFVILAGCVNPFAPALTDEQGDGNAILTEQQTPEEVLTNFSYAYNFKDSLVYADLLDSSFQFIYIDYDTDQPTSDHWGRDEDIKVTVRMFRTFNSLDLVWGETTSKVYLTEDSSRVELKKTFQLTLDGGEDIPSLSGWALFTFIRKKSGLWKILRWDDLSKI